MHRRNRSWLDGRLLLMCAGLLMLAGCAKFIAEVLWLAVVCVAMLTAAFSLVGLYALIRDREARVAPLIISWIVVFPAILASEVNFLEKFSVASVGWHVFASGQSAVAVAWALLGSATYMASGPKPPHPYAPAPQSPPSAPNKRIVWGVWGGLLAAYVCYLAWRIAVVAKWIE